MAAIWKWDVQTDILKLLKQFISTVCSYFWAGWFVNACREQRCRVVYASSQLQEQMALEALGKARFIHSPTQEGLFQVATSGH